MGCNAEQAKIKINEILTRSQIDSDPKSLELVNKKTDAFASLIDNKIKKQFVLNITESSEPGVVANPKTPEFNKLPSYKEGQKNMTYAGIGSRETSIDIQKEMYKIAKELESLGYVGQSGGAPGADKAFEGANQPWEKEDGTIAGTKEFTKSKANVTKWARYSDGKNTSSKFVVFKASDSNDKVRNIAKEIHPKKQDLSDKDGLDLHARNTFQVFGKNLDTPVDFVLFYAQEQKDSIRPKGGTGQAVEMARLKGIPTINMADKNWREQLDNVLSKNNEESKVDDNKSTKKQPKEKVVEKKVDTLKSEITDVYSMFKLLGINVESSRSRSLPSVADVVSIQKQVLANISNINELQKIFDNNKWIKKDTSNKNTNAYILDRIKRASSKDGKRSGADKFEKGSKEYKSKENEYIAYQIVEELNETLEQLLIDNKEAVDVLKKQKELFKITRFGADTKIKADDSTDDNVKYLLDKNGNPLTNLTRVQESLGKDSININEELNNTFNDLDNIVSDKNNDLLSFKNDENIPNVISDQEFDDIKKNTIDMSDSEKRKLYIDALENSNDKKNGGGYSENVQEDRTGMKVSDKDEDKKSGEFNKGYTSESAYSGIKKVKASVLKTYKAAVDKSLDSTPGSKYSKRDSAVLLDIDKQIEDLAQNNPELAKEIFGDSFVNNQSEEDTFNILAYNRTKGSSNYIKKNTIDTKKSIFKRSGDTYYTKNKINYRSYRIPKPNDKNMITTRNIAQSMIKALGSELSFGNGVADIEETYGKYNNIYTKKIKDLSIMLRDHQLNMKKIHSLKEWESIYKNDVYLKNKFDSTVNELVSSLGLDKIIKSDEIDGYEFSFSSRFVKDNEISVENNKNYTTDADITKGSSMDSKYEVDPDEVLASTMYLAEELYDMSTPASNSAYDISFAGLAATISDNLLKFGLDKKIEVYTHKLKNGDRKTRASYTFGEDVAYEYAEDEVLPGGYKFEINGGRIDIYFGEGYFEDDGVTERDVKQDVSLSTQKELVMHEIIHSMIEKAVEEDNKLERSLYMLKEQAMKQMSWKDFFKDEESAKNASNAEVQLAKDIFEYMNNPTEFLAYASTNENIFNAVNKVKLSQELIGRFTAKRGQEIGKMKIFLNRVIDAINKVYTAVTTSESARAEINRIISELIVINTKIEIQAIKPGSKNFSKYQAFGVGDKFNKTNEWLVNAEEGIFKKAKELWSADGVRDKAEATGRFIESIGDWRHLQWLRDSRIISDTVTDIVEDTTTESVAWFYEAIRDIKGKREKDKIDFASVMKKKVNAEFKEFDADERESITFMLQGDWKALGVSIEEYRNMLDDDSIIRDRVDELKKSINVAEYSNQAAMLGYYIVNGEAKGSAMMKNAHQIYFRYHVGKIGSPIQNGFGIDENIKMIDELASLYALLYTEKNVKSNIAKAIDRDADVVSFASDIYYSYRTKEASGQLGEFSKYMDKGYVRKNGQVDMKFDILPESKIIKNSKIAGLNHKIVRERPDIQKMLNSNEKYFMVIERDMDPARTQGVLDDISVIESGQEINSFGAGKDLTYEQRLDLRTIRFKDDKTYLNEYIDDSLESISNRKSYSVADFDISGQITGYSERISEADRLNYGRVNNDISDILGNTTSHIQSKEKALLNNQRFVELLIADSDTNAGKPGYVFLSPKSKSKELQKYWAMIPDYSRAQIEYETTNKGIWVKQSRINNIVGYKDISISNLKLFGFKLEDYPQWQKAIRIIEYVWMELAKSYKGIIVKLMPQVVASNATSNMIVAMRHGIGPIEYALAFKNAWSELDDYLQTNEKKISIEIDRDRGVKGLDDQINILEKRLERNGFRSLINDGQFSMIFEDLDNDSPSKSTHVKDVVMQKTEKLFGKKAAENLEEIRQNIYVTKDTRAHRAIEKLTIFNDIINKKIIEDKMLDDMKGMTFASESVKQNYIQGIRNYLDQLFTNYSYLLNVNVKWMTDMLILNFIKYFLRQGKAQLSMSRRVPLGTAIAESIDTFVWDMPDPIDQYQNIFDTLGNKIGTTPVEMVGGLIFPNIFMPFRD